MTQLLKILVTGDKHFNNYFFAYPYLKELIPPHSVIVSRGEQGSDMIASVFADSSQLAHESYPIDWDTYGKGAARIRDSGVIKMSRYVIIFWDGEDINTKSLIEMAKKKFSKPTIIQYSKDDIIEPHPSRVVNIRNSKCDVYCGRSSVYGNPFVLTNFNDRELVILQYTDYLIKNTKLIEEVLKLKTTDILGCHCAPKLCHCDVLSWLLDHSRDELKTMLAKIKSKNEVDEFEAKNIPQSCEFSGSKVSDFDTPSRLYSKHGILVANGWTQVVEDEWMNLVEIPDSMIVKDNLHLSKKTVDLLAATDEFEIVSIKYHTNETKNIPVILCKVGFASSPCKEGYWYVNIHDVVPEK